MVEYLQSFARAVGKGTQQKYLVTRSNPTPSNPTLGGIMATNNGHRASKGNNGIKGANGINYDIDDECSWW